MNYIKIDKTIKKALYLQIKDSIEEAIQQGILSDNDRLPTESELCEVFGISDIVVKNAYKLLVKQGLIMRVQGSGTFVSTRKIYKFPLKGFDKLGSFAGYSYTTKEKRIILFDQNAGQTHIMEALKLKETDLYSVSKYVIFIENAEVLLQTVYLPEKSFPKLSIYDIERYNLSDLMTKRYDHHIFKIKNGFSPINLSSSEAMLLNTYKHAAAHRVRTTIMSSQDEPLLYLETLFLGQYTQFEVIMG